MDPVSPIKTLAGFELYTKNPKRLPANIILNILAVEFKLYKIILVAMNTGIDTEVASPSNPSVKLVALDVPIITKIKNG